MSRLSQALESGEFVITGEVAPPRGTDVSGMLEGAKALAPYCHAVNVTDNQAATLHLSSLAASKLLVDAGIEPIYQLTARDRNRLAIESDLLGASTMGIENLLLLTGDHPQYGDHPQARGVFDIDSSQMIETAVALNEGRDMYGRPLEGATRFFIGAATFPEAEPWDIQARRTRAKIAAGARFFQTQAYYDEERFARAADLVHGHGAKILAGILLLRSPKVIDYINANVAGLFVPEAVRERIASAADPFEESVAFATEQVARARELADGIHLMTLGRTDVVPGILEGAGLA